MDIRCFKDVKKEYMPSLIWDWCAKPTPEEIDEKLKTFSAMGLKRVYLRPSKGLITGYLSDDYFELVRTAARRCARHGIDLWICDENSNSSGSGGGEITSVHDYRMKDIVLADKADLLKTDTVVSENGNSYIVLRDMSQVRGLKRLPVPDITDSFVAGCFIEEVYDRYIRSCKRFIGCEISGFSTRISLPENALLYSKKADTHSDFKALTDSSISHRKAEYFENFSSLISSGFSNSIKEKCHENNLRLSLTVDGASFISRQANYLECDNPYLEVFSENISFTDIKLITSIRAIFGKTLSFRIKTPSYKRAESRFNTALFLASFGANEICFESCAFSLSDRRKYEPYTTVFSEDAEAEISDRIARLCHLSDKTEEKADLLVIYPSYAICAAYADKAKIKNITDEFEALMKKLIEKGLAFHVVDETILKLYTKKGNITLGGNTYSKVLLPCTSLYSESTISIIKESTSQCFTHEEIPSLEASDFDDDALNSLLNLPFSVVSDTPVFINRRIDSNGEYIYLFAQNEDANITLFGSGKKIFTADCTDGEFYELENNENGECTFLIESGKTVILLNSDSVYADIAPPLAGGIVNSHIEKLSDLPFMLTASDENILPLKTAHVCFGHKSYRDGNIDELHKAFYSLNDGETVKVKYPFNVKKDGIGEVMLYIENKDSIPILSLNGKPLPEFSPSQKDPRFFGADIGKLLSDGKNTLALEYKKCNNYTPDYESRTPSYYAVYSLTSFEPVYLAGDFDCADGEIFPAQGEYKSDVSLSGMPYYHGALHYAVKLPEEFLHESLLVVEGDFDICTVKIGKRSKTFFSGTPMAELFEIDSMGVAEIIIYNTPYNLFRTKPNPPQKFGITSIYIAKRAASPMLHSN